MLSLISVSPLLWKFQYEQQRREEAENKVQILEQELQTKIGEVCVCILHSRFLSSHRPASVQFLQMFFFQK